MYSSNNTNPVFPLVIVPLVLLLSSCSESSEYGKKSDYEKLGAVCIASEDVTAPIVSYESPTDNTTYNSPATTVAVTFSETMATGSVTTNTNDTSCSGSFQLSSDNFTTCIKMSAAPVASDNDTIFTITPASSLSAATTFKVKITTSVTDISCNTLGSDNSSILGFSTSPSGSGTISGSVQMDNGSPFYEVGVSDALWGSHEQSRPANVATTTTDTEGEFSQTSLALGWHSLTYSKSGYFDENQSSLLDTDGQTNELGTVRMLPDNCTAGTMSGTITDAVTGDNMSNVSLSIRKGVFENLSPTDTQGFITIEDAGGSTDSNGTWSLNALQGWYTIRGAKSGYYTNHFYVYSCGNQADQNNSMSELLNEGEMRIMLSWPKTNPQTATDLDSHLQIPDNASSTYHLYYPSPKRTFYYATNTNTCSSCSSDQLSDNVTLDKDHNVNSSPASPPGDETITISKVRSGTYSFSVHNASDRSASSSDNLSKSRAKVKVFYCPLGTDCNCNACPAAGNLVKKKFHTPNDNGTLWKVFTFNTSVSGGSGFTRLRTMTYEDTPADVY